MVAVVACVCAVRPLTGLPAASFTVKVTCTGLAIGATAMLEICGASAAHAADCAVVAGVVLAAKIDALAFWPAGPCGPAGPVAPTGPAGPVAPGAPSSPLQAANTANRTAQPAAPVQRCHGRTDRPDEIIAIPTLLSPLGEPQRSEGYTPVGNSRHTALIGTFAVDQCLRFHAVRSPANRRSAGPPAPAATDLTRKCVGVIRARPRQQRASRFPRGLARFRRLSAHRDQRRPRRLGAVRLRKDARIPLGHLPQPGREGPQDPLRRPPRPAGVAGGPGRAPCEPAPQDRKSTRLN